MKTNRTIQTLTRMTLAIAGLAVLSLPAFATTARAGAMQSSGAQTQMLPPALRALFYRSLAKDAGSAYDVNAAGCATLPGPDLTACFDDGGAHFKGAGSLALHLAGYGRGRAIEPTAAVKPAINGNQVSYDHGNLSEWWRVLPVGFEQGFTIARRPAGEGRLTLALATDRQSAGMAAQGTVSWGRLRYGDLVVTDANGKIIPATMKVKDHRILIAVNDADAAYPLTVDPLVWLEQEVAATDGAANSFFGYSAVVSGNTAVIGAPMTAVNGNAGQGAAYVFNEANGRWTQTAELVASDGAANDNFGYTVALDGTTILVGAPVATVNGNAAQGAAYVFVESNGSWSQTAKLLAGDGAAAYFFGHSVAVSGSTALIGAPDTTVNGNETEGSSYVFTETGGSWTQTAELTASDGAAQEGFGWWVALDGSTALVGADGATVNGNLAQGAAYVFDGSNNVWNQTAKLIASDGQAYNSFGYSVALSGDTAVVGAIGASVNGVVQGAAYVFNESNGNWSQTAKLAAGNGAAGDYAGVSVATDGTTTLVGALGSAGFRGTAYVFSDSGGMWTQTGTLVASDGVAQNFFGISVGVSGSTALAGAYNVNVKGNAGQGAAYFYGGSDLDLAVSAPQSVEQGQQYVSQTIATNNASAATPAVSATITVPAAASFVSATASQGSCSEASGLVTCAFGQIAGDAGAATANVTLKATGNVGDTIENVSGIAKAEPPLSASAATTITAGGVCPGGYSEYDGNLNAGQRTHSPVYQAPAGRQNAILSGPSGFQLYVVFRNAQGRKVFRIPGNEVHRQAPAGTFTWVVRAGHTGGAYTLCVLHP